MCSAIRRGLFGALLCVAATASGAAAEISEAVAEYDISISGIPIGDARLATRVGQDRFTVEVAAGFRFLFWGGDGVARTEGASGDGLWAPVSYRLDYEGVTRPGAVEIDFEGARAARWDRSPPLPEEYREGRTEVSPEDLEGAVDPLTAFVVRAPSAEAACARTVKVFSGYVRFDVDLAPSQGAAADPSVAQCAVTYRPVSGHRPDSANVERLRDGGLGLRLARIGGDVWAPDLLSIATRFGTLEVERRLE